MKKSIIALNIGIIFLILLSTSCSKYEEGPFISFQTKKDRLVNTWELTEINENGEIWNFISGETLLLKEDGTGAWDYLAYEAYIEWKFDDNKENLLIKEGTYVEQSYKIIKLTKDELWLQHCQGEDIITKKYIPENMDN